MEFDELLITTGVDALVRLVKERQKIELEEIASILNIPSETIEDWARVLEEEGIIRIEYRLTRIYLAWVKPSEEEVAAEKESFLEEKKEIETSLDELKGRVGDQTSGLEDLRKSFSEFYSKAYTKMADMEKRVAPLPAAKTIGEDALAKYRAELAAMETPLRDMHDAIDAIRKDVQSLGIQKDRGKSSEAMAKLEDMTGELDSMKEEMAALRKRAAQEEGPSGVSMPTVRDIKKKFETMQKDFSALRSRNAQMREDMTSLHESSEILKSVAESIMGQEDKIGHLHEEVASLAQESEELMKKATAISNSVKQNVDLIERLGDSVTVAKGVLKKFPAQEKVFEELEKLRKEEDAVAEKTESLQKIIEAVGGKQVTAKEFTELAKKMDNKMADVKKDLEGLEASLQEDKSTYLTFQKIKERIVPSIESYQSQLDTMQQKISRINDDALTQMERIRIEAKGLQESLKGSEMQSAMKIAGEVKDKKTALDEIRNSLEELSTISDNINKRITLLSRQAKLLELRAGTEAGAVSPAEAEEAKQKEKEIRAQVELTREEEVEFVRKREELKKLIQKLWEQ